MYSLLFDSKIFVIRRLALFGRKFDDLAPVHLAVVVVIVVGHVVVGESGG